MTSLLDHGAQKFPQAELLASSEGRGWSGVAAELRRHPAAELPPILPSQVEITMTLSGDGSGVVRRSGNGRRQETPVAPGNLWLCPAGVYEDSISISRPIARTAHIYLSTSVFADLSVESRSAALQADSIDYLAGLEDPLVGALVGGIVSELQEPTTSGPLLVQALSLSLAAKVVTSYGTRSVSLTHRQGAIDPVRLRRVLDYINDNLESDLTIDVLSRIACLSPFHFSRAFRVAMGVPPHRYVAQQRFRHASNLLRTTDLSIADIALACRFSSQANFARAFVRASGVSPGTFRRQRTLQ